MTKDNITIEIKGGNPDTMRALGIMLAGMIGSPNGDDTTLTIDNNKVDYVAIMKDEKQLADLDLILDAAEGKTNSDIKVIY